MVPLLLFLILSTGVVQRPADVVKWSAAAPPSASPGATVKISLTARISEGWKLYALTQPKGGPTPLGIELAGGAPFTISRKQIAAPKSKTLKDENFGVETLYYDREAVFTVPVTLPKSASGTITIPFEITYQACGNDICLRPFTEKVSVDVAVR